MDSILLDHIALAAWRIEDMIPFLSGVLGGRPHEGASSRGFDWAQFEYAGAGRIEALQPTGPRDGFLYRFLAQRGPGVHHATFKVRSLEEACARVRAHGYEIAAYDDSDPSWKEAFLHPKQALGILVQLAQEDPSVPSQFLRPWTFPKLVSERPPAVTLVGLRLVARSEQSARRQWGEVLGGECQQTPEGLAFRWNDSPLRLSVVIDPDGREGPDCVEISTARKLDLTGGPHPQLGVRFSVVS